MINAHLCAIGMAVPEKLIDNQYFETLIETTDEWIVSRTGIRTRYHTAVDEFTSNLCVRAVEDLAAHYAGTLDDVDFMAKDGKRFSDSGGWGYAVFEFDAATDTFRPGNSTDTPPQAHDAKCGYACHTIVAAKDYVFTAYPKR